MTTHDGQGMLKACPFCGCDDVETDCYSRDDKGVCLEPAMNCNGCGAIVIFDFKTEEPWREIRERWDTRTVQPSVATEGEVERREDHWRKWPQGDAGDAIDFACDVIMTGSFGAMSFLEQWREGRADEWPEYMHWLKVQRDGARAAIAAQVTK